MKRINISVILILGTMICACDRDELFEREQYKNQFALLSDDGFNVFAEEFDLSKEAESTGYVVVGCGGAHEIEQEARVDMVEDLNLLFKYNRTNYDTDESKYAQKLSADKYSIDNYRITVQAGQRTGRMPIKVRADGLSPDSIYFIPLKVQTFSAYEFHPQKATILYRVLLKNYWATQKTVTSYALRGVRNSVNVMGTKQVFPVSGNKVRIMAGNETFASNTNTINAGSITLEIAEDGHVTITPWKEINVTQIDDDPLYPNTFTIEDTGFNYYKTFLLRYNYVFNGTTYQMQEELRLEFNPQKEK